MNRLGRIDQPHIPGRERDSAVVPSDRAAADRTKLEPCRLLQDLGRRPHSCQGSEQLGKEWFASFVPTSSPLAKQAKSPALSVGHAISSAANSARRSRPPADAACAEEVAPFAMRTVARPGPGSTSEFRVSGLAHRAAPPHPLHRAAVNARRVPGRPPRVTVSASTKLDLASAAGHRISVGD